jgi:hypothetical protein
MAVLIAAINSPSWTGEKNGPLIAKKFSFFTVHEKNVFKYSEDKKFLYNNKK